MILELSDYYQILLGDIHDEWTIEYDDLNNGSYDLDINQKIITVHNFGLKTHHLMASPYFKPQVMLALVESLRMVRHVEWLDGVLNRYHPEIILLIGRLCVADAMAHKIHYAWDTKLEGDESLWRFLLCGADSDTALAYSKTLEKCLTTGVDEDVACKKSMAAALNMWFVNDQRLKDCDHDTLNVIDDMISEGTSFANQSIKANAVTCMTLMGGDTTTYLDQFLIHDIIKNPYYRAVDDAINQSHLMQCIADMNKVYVGGLVFQDASLAARFTFCE